MAGPEVASAGAAMTGLEIADRCFVDLEIAAPSVLIPDLPVNATEPVGRQIRPIAKCPAMERNSLAGENLRLAVIWEMVGKVVCDDLRDEPRGGGAAILQGWRQGGDDGLGGGISLSDVFGTHQTLAEEPAGTVSCLTKRLFVVVIVVKATATMATMMTFPQRSSGGAWQHAYGRTACRATLPWGTLTIHH